MLQSPEGAAGGGPRGGGRGDGNDESSIAQHSLPLLCKQKEWSWPLDSTDFFLSTLSYDTVQTRMEKFYILGNFYSGGNINLVLH